MISVPQEVPKTPTEDPETVKALWIYVPFDATPVLFGDDDEPYPVPWNAGEVLIEVGSSRTKGWCRDNRAPEMKMKREARKRAELWLRRNGVDRGKVALDVWKAESRDDGQVRFVCSVYVYDTVTIPLPDFRHPWWNGPKAAWLQDRFRRVG